VDLCGAWFARFQLRRLFRYRHAVTQSAMRDSGSPTL
jgi:hypothetical protein